MLNQYAKSDLELMVGDDERILWRGRPNKLCYVLEGIFNPMLPFALLWLLFDSIFVIVAVKSDQVQFELIAFLLLHLMPVWIYFGGALFVFRKYKHTEYIVTDKGVYISGGLLAYTCQMKPYTEISRINVHRGIFDQYLKVGDIVFTSQNMILNQLAGSRGNMHTDQPMGITIADIPDYQKVFELVKKLQTDIYADTMYPNNLRPKENHGYKTTYRG